MSKDRELSTEATEEEIANGVEDEFGVVYSKDGKCLLKCENKKLERYEIRKGTEVICDNAFWGCESLNQVTFPDSVTIIGDLTFYGCFNLQEVYIPNTITSIGDDSFSFCKSLQLITIPKSMAKIGSNPFVYCEKISIQSESERFIVQDKMLIDTKEHRLIIYFGHNSSVLIPKSVSHIGDDAFINCKSIKELTFSDSVTNIGESAFKGCESLQQVTFPTSLVSIGESAFSRCFSLRQIVIPDSVTEIGNAAFGLCDSLQQIIIPENSIDKFIKILPVSMLDKVYYIKKAITEEQIAEKRNDLPF